MPNSAQPIEPLTRREVLRRARFWVDQRVHYFTRDGLRPAQALDPDGRAYRTDCSGYVCMAWRAPSEPSTHEFDQLGHEITRDDLQPGDALLWKGEGGYGVDGGHVLLFARWADPGRTHYLGFELAGNQCARLWTVPYPYRDADPRYVPWRCRHIQD
jgi:hypothetical protein